MASKLFQSLKKSRGKTVESLSEATSQLKGQKFEPDSRYWTPTLDKAGNGFAIVRLMPAPPQDLERNEEAKPFVRYFDHAFKGPGGWFIEKSLTSLGKQDPVSEYNTVLWSKDMKQQARLQKRRLHYICNLYVIKDSNNPDAEGKVFLHDFGQQVFDKFESAWEPKFEDDPKIDPFDLWEGANFRFKITTKTVDINGQRRNVRDFEKCVFDDPAPLFDDDKKMEDVWQQCHSLMDEVAPDKFKTYDELKAKLYRVLQLDGGAIAGVGTAAAQSIPSLEKESESADTPPWDDDSGSSDDDDDDNLSFFERLAKEED